MPPEGERSLHSAISATRPVRRKACWKPGGAGAAARDCGTRPSIPLPLSSSIAARGDGRMRSRMGAAFVAISGSPPPRLGAGCGLLQDSLHPLDALLDLVDRVSIGKPQIAFARRAECTPSEQGDPPLVQHPVGQHPFVQAGLRDVRKHVKGSEWLVAADPPQSIETIDHEVAASL